MQPPTKYLVALVLLALASPLAAARQVAPGGPFLQLAAPAQVQPGAQIELTLTLHDAAGLGGYEAELRFDATAAHFNGLEQQSEGQRRAGRGIGPLGPVERPGRVAFGAYSCPVAQCVGARSGARTARGADGTLTLARVALVADQPGTLELSFATRFVDAAGKALAVSGASQRISIQVGAGNAPQRPAVETAPEEPAAGRPPAGTEATPSVPAGGRPAERPSGAVSTAGPNPLDRTGDGKVTHADLIALALAWTLAQEQGAACGPAPDADVNGDGCIDIADLQRMAAAYSPPAAAAPAVAPAGTGFTVNSTDDSADSLSDGLCATAGGVCTLRAAIAEANLAPGANTIGFNLPGAGVQTIALTKPLPVLSDETGGTTIDGYTQPGAQPNSLAQGSNALLMVQLRAAPGVAEATIEALHITAPNNSVRGLAFFTFRRALLVYGPAADANSITGNFIGTDAAASYQAPAIADSGNGVELREGCRYNRIGGPTPAERNVISGNPKNGVATFNGGTDYNTIAGNLIGLAPAGDRRLPNVSHGIDINSHSSNNLVGGSGPGEGNVIAGNGGEGVEISHGRPTQGNKVLGNLIGIAISGNGAPDYSYNGFHGVHIEDGPTGSIVAGNVIGNNRLGGVRIAGLAGSNYPLQSQVYNNRIGVALNDTPIPNRGYGLRIEAQAAQSVIGPDNLIAYNPVGVQVFGAASDFNTISRNTIYANDALGIDLDGSANQQIAPPQLQAATPLEARGTACAGCHIELFLATGSAGIAGQGRAFAGAANADATGAFSVALGGMAAGDYLTATATDALGNSSEFALNLLVIAVSETTPTPSATGGPAPTPTLTPTPVPTPGAGQLAPRAYLPLVAR